MVLRLLERADALIEGSVPVSWSGWGSVPKRAGRRNPRIVFGRGTGWGQEGPLAESVGHDLNYLAVTGALSMIGPRNGLPAIPLNLLGDYAGGGLYLALGIVSALLEARTSGKGQIVDAAMIDGVNPC